MISPRVRAMVQEKPVELTPSAHGKRRRLIIDQFNECLIEYRFSTEPDLWLVETGYAVPESDAAALIAWAWMERLAKGFVNVNLDTGGCEVKCEAGRFFAPSLLDALAEAVEASIGDTVEGGR